MALFPRWTNTVARLTGAVALGTPLAVVAFLVLIARTPFVTHQNVEVEQPVQFDHRHHSGEQGIDCLFCHRGADRSPVAGVPTVSVCMGCHGQVWNQSPRLEPLRQAYFTGQPIRWVKVHDLPDFVYFDHSAHHAQGVGCVACHGRVDQMPAVYQAAPLTMAWCLDCHRDPAAHLEAAARLGPPSPAGAPAPAPKLSARTACDACHR